MFNAEHLNLFLETADTVVSEPHVFAEINLNDLTNIKQIGVYKYRQSDSDITYRLLPTAFDPNDLGDHYMDNDISYTEVGGTYDDGIETSQQLLFRHPDDLFNQLYDLEDCFRHNRPRSGINKLLYLAGTGMSTASGQFIDGSTKTTVGIEGTIANPSSRPRFYVSSKDDYFKYWTSYKREGFVERGISYNLNGIFKIDDAVPFVVYKESVPANRIVVKIQTLVGEENIGTITNDGILIDDPFFGQQNARVPQDWSIEILRDGSWESVYTLTDDIPADGQIELGYGIIVPDAYKDKYLYKGELTSDIFLPPTPRDGDLWLVIESENDAGMFYIAVHNDGLTTWEEFPAIYGWTTEHDGFNGQSKVVRNLVDPPSFFNGSIAYREFQMIAGLRIVVRAMSHPDAPFDLIELSPRLVMDWTDRTESFSVNKIMADLSTGAMPIGNLMASTGSISLSNTDSAFNVNNVFDGTNGSIISSIQNTRMKISFYEEIKNAFGYDYYVPLKTLYTEENPNINNDFSNISIELRDLYFLFESMTAPSLIMTDVSLSRAIMTLMDYVGFTNYVFKRLENQTDPIIPYFFVPPDKSVAEIMIQLAAATQSAMYFDEYNNLIIATKEYALPNQNVRATDLVLRGNDTDDYLSNIKAISSADKQVFNSGTIEYTKRYIQRTQETLRQPLYQAQDQTWIYAPSLLWEATGDSATKAINDKAAEQSAFTLSAMPLARDLSANVPEVVASKVINNIIDVGESASYAARYNGYLYANGEIIKYDAIQYVVDGTGLVWITSVDEYQNYLLSLPFGKRLYPTGNIRIWSEPYRDAQGVPLAGPVKKHGRGQFGTTIVGHNAGLDPYWSDKNNVRGMMQNTEPLFSLKTYDYNDGLHPEIIAGQGIGGTHANRLAESSSRNGIMKNNVSQRFFSDSELSNMKSLVPGTIQSSALIFGGPKYDSAIIPRDHVSYIYKPLRSNFSSFGTRCRIIGKIESGNMDEQTSVGASTYYSLTGSGPESQTSIAGGSGGIGIQVNPETNTGYFFEIAALTKADPSSYNTETVETEINLGKIVGITQVDKNVVVEIDTRELSTVPVLSAGDSIKIDGIYASVPDGSPKPPSVNGTHIVDSITGDGTKISYTLATPPYMWTTGLGRITQNNMEDINLARLPGVTVTQSSDTPETGQLGSKAIDGILNSIPGDYDNEWATVAGKYGSWIELTFPESVTIDKVVLYDRPNTDDQVLSGTLSFSDGTSISVSELDNTGKPKEISFSARTVTSVKFTVGSVSATTLNIGLLEFEVWGIVGVPTLISQDLISASLDDSQVMTITTKNPTTLAVGNTINLLGFNGGPSYVEVNQGPVAVRSVSGDGRTISCELPIADHTYETFEEERYIKKANSKQVEISNMWFYKTVSDDFGGRIKSFTVGSGYIDVTVDSHNLSAGNKVTIPHGVVGTLDTISGDYEIASINGNVIRLNHSGGAGSSGTITEYTTYNTIGLTNPLATTYKLWSGLSNIIVDSGLLYGQYRAVAEKNTTVYDIGVEFVDSSVGRTFYLYLNNRQVATVFDPEPLRNRSNMALFVRGQSKLMFENIYALGENIASGYAAQQIQSSHISKVFGIPDGINQSDALRKYAVSGLVQSSYLSGLNSNNVSKYNMYFDEFGTIMREAAYFSIRYDKAYPALYAKLAPVLSRMQGYVVSGFYAGAYGAEFLIFNCLDNLCSLDPSTGNYLRINGVTFTQNTTKTLTVDDYVKKLHANIYTDKQLVGQEQLYDDIKMSRVKHGKNDFRIASDYIQNDDAASNLMAWVLQKTTRLRKNIGVEIFGIPTIQLGDIVSISYKDDTGMDVLADEDMQFVVYNIEYSRSESDVTMRLFLTEV